MKKLVLFALVALLSMPFTAQDKLYVLLELMQVDNDQEFDYMETEKFWKKIHQERKKAGEIVGWDLWHLLPGGEHQGYQYATATLYDSAEKMFGDFDFWAHVKAAYPDMSQDDIMAKMESTSKSRDLAVRIFMETIAETNGDFNMDVGTAATMDLMKVDMGNYAAYENAEMEVFQPMHQKMVDNGNKGYWGLLRFISPIGSETYASHLTVNMYENMNQLLSQHNGDMTLTDEQQKAIQKGIETRDMKFVYLARVIDMVR